MRVVMSSLVARVLGNAVRVRRSSGVTSHCLAAGAPPLALLNLDPGHLASLDLRAGAGR